MQETSLLHEAVRLFKLKRELEDELKKTKQDLANMLPTLTEWMAEQGMQRTSIDGVTASRRTDRFVKQTDPQQLAFELQNHGMGFLVKESVNTNSLRSAILELLDDEERSVPPEVMACIELVEQETVGFRKG